MKKAKPYWEMNTEELAEATKEFDDVNYTPHAVKPTEAERSQLRIWQQKRRSALNRFRVAVVLDKRIIAQTDSFAANHGITFSDVVTDALRKHLRKKTA